MAGLCKWTREPLRIKTPGQERRGKRSLKDALRNRAEKNERFLVHSRGQTDRYQERKKESDNCSEKNTEKFCNAKNGL